MHLYMNPKYNKVDYIGITDHSCPAISTVDPVVLLICGI